MLRKPASLEEAQAYLGQVILKKFEFDGQEYKGKIEDVDTELETEDGGVEQGFFFRILYEEDGDQEHLVWEELVKWLKNAQKKLHTKGPAAGSTPAAQDGADVVAVNDRSNNRRQRHAAGSSAAAAAAAGDGSAAAQHVQPASASGGRSAGKKRGRGQEPSPQQQQQQDVPAPAAASHRKHPRKSAHPHMSKLPAQQQQQQQGRRQPAPASDSESESEQSEEEEEDAVEDADAGSSDGGAPQKRRRSKQQQRQQQRPAKKARGSRQTAAAPAGDDDVGMDSADAGAAAADEAIFDAAEGMGMQPDEAAAASDEEPVGGRQLRIRQAGLAGHVKQVQVVNFMCHHNLLMDFGTHVNVISGRNGSGKSAVLQAMQVCLGSKVKETGRGDNVKQLIRTGCNEARIKVTLWNTGEDAYQHDVFGDWLTIERVLKMSGGASEYKLYNSAGKLVSKKGGFRGQIEPLLDHLNVDASNPLAVLTQDTARNFLCGSVADKKKYEIFMKATCLQTFLDNLTKGINTVDQMKEAFKEVEEEHRARKAELLDLRAKLEKLQQSASMVQQRDMWERASCWALVKTAQVGLTDLKDRVESKAPAVRAECEAAIANADQTLEDLRRQEEELLAAQGAEDNEMKSFTDAMATLAQQLKVSKTNVRTKQTAAKKLESQMQHIQADIKAAMEAGRETNDDRQREYEAKLQEWEAAVAQARAELSRAEQELLQLQQGKEERQQAFQAKEAAMKGLQSKLLADQQTLANLQDHLQQLQQAKGQKLALFGAHARLRQKVDQNSRRFKHVPIGPIGAHLTLTDTKWAVAGEVALGGSLEMWLVDNKQDHQLLMSMARDLVREVPPQQKQQLQRITALVTSFNRGAYRISQDRQLRPGWRSLRQFIKIDHPEPQAKVIIDNKLMDNSSYESVVVDEDIERCRDAAYNKAAGQFVPRVVHVTGTNFSRSRGDTVIAAFYVNHGRPPRIGASFEDSMAQTQQGIQQAQASLSNTQQQLQAVNAELQQMRQQAGASTHREKLAMGAKTRAAHRVNQLQAQAPVLETEGADGEDLVAEQLRQLQERLSEVQLQYDRAAMELQEARLEEEKFKRLHETRDMEMQQTLTQMGSRTEQLDVLGQEKQKASAVKAKAQEKLRLLADQVAAAQQRMDSFQQVHNKASADALKMCTEEEGWAAFDKACAALREGVAIKMRVRLAKEMQSGKMRFESQEAFEQAVQHHTQNSVDTLICYKEHFGVKLMKKKADELEKTITAAEQEAGGNQADLERSLKLAEFQYERDAAPVKYMEAVVRLSDVAVKTRWNKFQELFESVRMTVSSKFNKYMHRRGHEGRVDICSETGELRLLVKINSKSQGTSAKQVKAVKDLKQLSGGERSFTTVAFILALGKMTESPFRAMDEYDVFMDAVNRRIATQTLLEFARDEPYLQFVLLTPQDLQAVEDAKRHITDAHGQPALPEGFVKVQQMLPAREAQQQHH